MHVKILGLLLLLLLSACAGEVYDGAYTASGDGFEEKDLRKDEQFTATDDLNIVVKLNKHDDPVIVMARFIDPNGDILQEVETEAASNVGTAILGVDYEARTDTANQWVVGRYRVDIFVDDQRVDTVYFRVD